MPKYELPLSVATPDGRLIIANIRTHNGIVIISIGYLKEVELDNPSFAKDGKILLKCKISKYEEMIIRLTSYIEHLILKGMADESLYTSLGGRSRPRRNKKQNIKRKNGKLEGRFDSSIHTGSRGGEQTEGIADGVDVKDVLAEVSDSSISRED